MMAKDLRKLFENERKQDRLKLTEGHEARFLEKLDAQLPQQSTSNRSGFWRIAASIVILISLGFAGFNYFDQSETVAPKVVGTTDVHKDLAIKTLGDVSPDLKKIENYYLANINLELSRVKLTPNNKELFDGYVLRLAELNKEYKRLSVELTKNGPNELTISALIDNLKLRLNLMYRLKAQLKTLSASEENASAKTKS